MIAHRMRSIVEEEYLGERRFWRIRATGVKQAGVDGVNPMSFFRLSMFESVDGSGTDLCLNKPAYAINSYSASYLPAKAVDGNLTTRWSSDIGSTTNKWFYVDLQGDYDIHSLGITLFNGQLSSQFQLEVSDNTTTWHVVAVVNTGDLSGLYTRTLLYTNL